MSRRGVALVGLAMLVGPVACQRDRVGPPPVAPGVADPADAIPADLDVVVRVDLRRMRDALGAQTFDSMRTRAQQVAGAPAADQELVTEATARADVLWLALRPGRDPGVTDTVMVLEGRFDGFDPRAHGGGDAWRPPSDLGSGWMLFARRKVTDRGAPARVYLRAPDLVVLVSVAEIDSAERTIEQGVDDPHLEPPRRGAVSVAARAGAVATLVQDTSPAAARLLRRAVEVRAHVDVGAGGVKAEIEVVFRDEATARGAAQAARSVLDAVVQGSGIAADLARQVRVATVGENVVVRLSVSPEAVERAAGQPGSDPR